MPKRALKMIFEWLDLHKDELLYDWQLAKNRKKLLKITPIIIGGNMFLHVVNAEYVGDYILLVEFNDNTIKKVDLKNELYGEIFEPLKNKEFFKDFFISQNTIEWKNGADFAPEFLYKIGS